MDALLFYNGRYNERHDFIALEVVGGQVRFSFSLGSEVVIIDTFVEGGVSHGVWRRINVYYLNRVRDQLIESEINSVVLIHELLFCMHMSDGLCKWLCTVTVLHSKTDVPYIFHCLFYIVCGLY